MGDLVTQVPYSEITATLEILDRWGVKRGHLEKFRGASTWFQQQIAEAIISSEENFFTGKAIKVDVQQPTVSSLLFPPLQAADEFEKWLLQVLTLELACHLNFFGQEFDLADFKTTLEKYGPEKIKAWLALDLEPHFLPKVVMILPANFPGWKVKPEKWFWEQLVAEKILRARGGKLIADGTVELEGITILVDTRLKPHYKDGKQMWEGDTLLGPILIQLREGGEIAKYEHGIQGSRFGVSADEWEDKVRPVLAEKLGLRSSQVRLERTIEANVVPQLFSYMPRRDDGKTDTWTWYDEYFEARSGRLYGGMSVGGGLADVYWDEARRHWSNGSFRPLAVL